ncbi:MAG: hypothetical protein ACI4O0_07905 [Candidatus Limivicinus sp.]
MVGKTNVTGSRLRSIISVTYPEGSVCTCSNGTKTLTAKDTSGKALFNVPAGEWEVSCTDGSETASETVVITTEGQLESIILDYTFYLFKSGRGFRNGFRLTIQDGTTYESDDTNAIYLLDKAAIFNPGIDLSKFSTIHVDGYSTGSGYHHKFGVSKSATDYGSNPSAETGNPWKAYADIPYQTRAAVSLDISGITDADGYIKIGVVNNGVYVYNIWLE